MVNTHAGGAVLSTDKITMKEVARLSGVTIGTVSHVIHGTASISEETKQRVLKVIEQTGYTLDPMAGYMRSKRSHIIGLLIPDLNNYFFSKCASVLIGLAYNSGYTVMILENGNSPDKERENIQILQRNKADAVITMCGLLTAADYLPFLKENKPVLLADQVTDNPDVLNITYDNQKIMHEIIGHLQKAGYTRIGFMSESLQRTNLKTRYDAYIQELENAGLVHYPGYDFISDLLCMDHMYNGYMYMNRLLETHDRATLPEVIVTSADMIAIGCMRALKEHGMSVPDDMALIGWDDQDISSFVSPRITTVGQHQDRLAEKIWEMMEARLQDSNRDSSGRLVLEQTFIVRESCLEARNP